MPLRVGLDATPLLGPRTGIGRYTASLLAALAAGDHPNLNLVATAFSARGRGALEVPPGVRVRARPVPARALQAAWSRTELPPVEWLAGPLEVFHATNFVLPPAAAAAGVLTVHDLAFLRLTSTVTAASARYRSLVPRSLRRARAVLTPSRTVADQVREAYADELARSGATVLAVPHGVDESWRHAAPPTPELRRWLGLPGQYVVFVGTPEPRKGLPTLLAAREAVPDAPPLVLVGPPGWGEQLDVGSAVVTGYLGEADLQAVVAGAAALALPSRDEGFGLPVLEALAAGTPVVASDLPALREVGGDAVTYAPVGDVEALAAALEQVLSQPGEADRRRTQSAGFSWARSAQAHLQAYRLASQTRPE